MNNKTIPIAVVVIVVVALGVFYFSNNNKQGTSTKNSSNQVMKESSDSMDKMNVETSYTDISPLNANSMLDANPEIIIIDVSPKYDEGHLPGAINYYVGDGSLDQAIPSLDKEKTYLVYCHVDSASIAGAEKLIMAGFENVFRLKGNYSAWVKAGLPIEVAINAVGNFKGNGFAIKAYDGKTFSHSVSANLSDPPAGKFYEGWLVKNPSDFISTGKMAKKGQLYILEYSTEKDLSEYPQVVITEETEANGLDNKPEAHVLEGSF